MQQIILWLFVAVITSYLGLGVSGILAAQMFLKRLDAQREEQAEALAAMEQEIQILLATVYGNASRAPKRSAS